MKYRSKWKFSPIKTIDAWPKTRVTLTGRIRHICPIQNQPDHYSYTLIYTADLGHYIELVSWKTFIEELWYMKITHEDLIREMYEIVSDLVGEYVYIRFEGKINSQPFKFETGMIELSK